MLMLWHFARSSVVIWCRNNQSISQIFYRCSISEKWEPSIVSQIKVTSESNLMAVVIAGLSTVAL